MFFEIGAFVQKNMVLNHVFVKVVKVTSAAR